jgi:hypothetical protein
VGQGGTRGQCHLARIAAFIAAFIFLMAIGVWLTGDNPAYSIRSVLMPGWLLIAANDLALIAHLNLAKRAPRPSGAGGGGRLAAR